MLVEPVGVSSSFLALSYGFHSITPITRPIRTIRTHITINNYTLLLIRICIIWLGITTCAQTPFFIHILVVWALVTQDTLLEPPESSGAIYIRIAHLNIFLSFCPTSRNFLLLLKNTFINYNLSFFKNVANVTSIKTQHNKKY